MNAHSRIRDNTVKLAGLETRFLANILNPPLGGPHSKPTFFARWRHWLPSRGNVLFTLLIAFSLLAYTRNAGAFPARAPAVTSAATIPYQGRLADGIGAPSMAQWR